MILADTTVAIGYERSRSPRLQQIIQAHPAAVCGITVAEMFAGVRTAKEEARCLAALPDFQRLLIPDALWETAGGNQSMLLFRAVTVQTHVAAASLPPPRGPNEGYLRNRKGQG